MKPDHDFDAARRRAQAGLKELDGFADMTYAYAPDLLNAYRCFLALDAENARLRALLEREAKKCPRCQGSGQEEWRQYDAASNEMEFAGHRNCTNKDCAEIRAELEKK